MGNARVSYAKKSNDNLEITDTNNYYAFGMNHIGRLKGIFGGYQSYKYNGNDYFQRIEPFANPDKNGFTSNEKIRTTLLSNQVNESLNEPQRKVYWGITLPTESVTSNKLK
ncbi:hypothetical protein [Chryseobacterium geocarposphaerae]|uniref:hypothetical protein n=1 Tax=Chryseobacterium geocarposphaerae TaxID=1416776 RepID=UPI000C23CE53|nr:hypothetical protein [Chryseobacterium geocarposphaerae]